MGIPLDQTATATASSTDSRRFAAFSLRTAAHGFDALCSCRAKVLPLAQPGYQHAEGQFSGALPIYLNVHHHRHLHTKLHSLRGSCLVTCAMGLVPEQGPPNIARRFCRQYAINMPAIWPVVCGCIADGVPAVCREVCQAVCQRCAGQHARHHAGQCAGGMPGSCDYDHA